MMKIVDYFVRKLQSGEIEIKSLMENEYNVRGMIDIICIYVSRINILIKLTK